MQHDLDEFLNDLIRLFEEHPVIIGSVMALILVRFLYKWITVR